MEILFASVFINNTYNVNPVLYVLRSQELNYLSNKINYCMMTISIFPAFASVKACDVISEARSTACSNDDSLSPAFWPS